MMTLRASFTVLSLLAAAATATAARAQTPTLTVTTQPERIVLGQRRSATIEIRGIAGSGPLEGTVNIGRILQIEQRPDHVRIRYRTPRKRFPQELCLLLWREGSEAVHKIQLPLFGRAVIPVRTRRRSKVELTISGAPEVHSRDSGRRGRVSFRILVPPGPDSARVLVTDAKGLKTEKRVPIRRRSYNRLALAVRPVDGGEGRPTFAVTLAVAESTTTATRPEVSASTADGEQTEPITVEPVGEPPERWSATWSPAPGDVARDWQIVARLPEQRRSRGTVTVSVPAWQPQPPVTAPPPKVRQPPPPPALPVVTKPAAPPRRERSLHATVGIGVGMMHNLGEFFAPHFSLDAGIEYGLPLGQLGLSALVGITWSSQDVVETQPAESASSKLLLLPIGLAVNYRLPLWRVAPYIGGAFVAQISRTANETSLGEQSVRHDLAFGGLFFAGADINLGPGRVFGQLGFQWVQLDTADVELLAGGIVIDLGYRFVL